MANRPEPPPVQRRRLAISLRKARERAGRTQEEAAQQLDARHSKISRIESATSGIRPRDLDVLIRYYCIPPDEAAQMHAWARAGRKRGRWSAHLASTPTWFRDYIDLEGGAGEIRSYQREVVPGIFQIEPYARSTFGYDASDTTSHMTSEEVDQHVQLRLDRQAILADESRTIRVVLSESALRRTIADAAVMRAQLRHIAEVADRPNVHLRVLPFRLGVYVPASYAFTILVYGQDAASQVIYLEDLHGADYLDDLDAVEAYAALWHRLEALSLDPLQSRAMALRLAAEQ